MIAEFERTPASELASFPRNPKSRATRSWANWPDTAVFARLDSDTGLSFELNLSAA